MASAPVIPDVTVEQYEQTPALFERYEYIDGYLREKPLPTWKHAQLQLWIGALLLRNFPKLAVGSELHSKLRATHWRIPDIAVQQREKIGGETYALAPLLLAIEIRSPEDRWSELLAKFEDYHEWGVPFCWLFDPESERAWTYHRSTDFQEVTAQAAITAGEIKFDLAEVFSVLQS